MILGLLASLTVPISGVVTQGINVNHSAIDIACRVGDPVYAAHDGEGNGSQSYTHGNTFTLVRSDGLRTSYSHLDTMEASGSYKSGDKIGTCGNTGQFSTGPHLHFESTDLKVLIILYGRN